MNKSKKSLGTAGLIIGSVLILGALALLLWWQISIGVFSNRIDDYLSELTSLMPPSQSAVLEERTDNRMPSLSVDGNDFVGILEFQNAGKAFPVGASWGKSNRFPCRYYGSVYDGSLVIGSNNQKGQISFVKELSVGDKVFFTDMTGNKYSYSITDILYREHANNEDLISEDSDLTLFVKNIYAFEYIIIQCNR